MASSLEAAEQNLIEEGQKDNQRMPLEVDRPAESEEAEEASPPWKKFALKVFVSVTLFLLLTVLLEVYAKEKVAWFSRKLMETIGLPGLFMFVFAADGLPQPFTYVPLIFCAVKAGLPKWVVFSVCAAASYSAALFGYGLGKCIRSLSCGESLFQRLVDMQPWVPDLMQRKGAMGVAMAAMMPIPLALATWTAGSFRITFWQFLIAGLFRMPKILVFVLLSGPGTAHVDVSDANDVTRLVHLDS